MCTQATSAPRLLLGKGICYKTHTWHCTSDHSGSTRRTSNRRGSKEGRRRCAGLRRTVGGRCGHSHGCTLLARQSLRCGAELVAGVAFCIDHRWALGGRREAMVLRSGRLSSGSDSCNARAPVTAPCAHDRARTRHATEATAAGAALLVQRSQCMTRNAPGASCVHISLLCTTVASPKSPWLSVSITGWRLMSTLWPYCCAPATPTKHTNP